MDTFKALGMVPGRAICYSGFREGQQPGGTTPDYDEVKEDLLILSPNWDYLRLYDCDLHSLRVLEVIKKENLDFKVMMGAYIEAEKNNYNCPWGGGVFSKKELAAKQESNERKINKLIKLANQYPEIIFSLSVGNEACVSWTDHLVPPERVLKYAEQVKNETSQPVTFCENYVPWHNSLEKLASELDFISIHTYPVWEYKSIDEALDYTLANYYPVAEKYPDKPVVITEAGWTTQSNGRGIDPENVNETFQKIYFEKLMAWADREGILTFYFEAFDEPWKGSPEALEPEKHWGLYREDRSPKLAMRTYRKDEVI
ncbi:MAG: glycosyl hydrolase [Balneolaceae bacterium]|nr:glycosyl hydrolase [Balneolaceae bacterium]MCH8547438.1 glycosyl hydrolase [Balneolaceae bacterium]